MKKLDSEKKNISISIAKKRFRRRIKSLKLNRQVYKQDYKNPLFSLSHYYYTKLRQLDEKKQKEQSKKLKLKVPSNFSMIENCDNTLELIEQLVLGASKKTKEIYLDQFQCSNIDLCAETVVSVLFKDIAKYYNAKLSGRYPRDERLSHIVRASGVTKILEVSKDNPYDMIIYPLTQGHKQISSAKESTKKEIEATKLIAHLDQCMNSCGWQLQKKGKEYLYKIIGEILDNAEIHSQKSSWWISAYMQSLKDNVGECHLVFLNFGESIYESMQNLDAGNPVRLRIEQLAQKHKKRGVFHTKFDESTLWTLYSLQEGVSRFSASGDCTNDRGQGLSDLVEFFQKIGKSVDRDPVMALISGDTYIQFDNDYKMNIKEIDGKQRRQIAFNEQNDLEQAPDEKKVRKLKHHFPGTIYSFKFYVDDCYLTKFTQGQNSNEN